MNWLRWALAVSLVAPLLGLLSPAPAAASLLGAVTSTTTTVTDTVTTTVATVIAPTVGPDVVLYEVTEAVGSKGNGAQGGFKSSVATLSGVARMGAVPCPPAIASDLLKGCWVVVRATGRADDVTGIGPVVGSFEVVVQDKNVADSPEIVVLRGHMSGDIDLSPAFLQARPLGTITGTYTLKGVAGTVMERQTLKGSFTGTFRLPYSWNGQASYMRDDGTAVPVNPGEYVLGYPAVRLEVTLR